MLTPSVFQQTPRFFSDLLESPMSEDWVKNFGFAMSDYATFPQTQDDTNNNNKHLLDDSTDPQLPSFHASFTVDDLCVKMGDDGEEEEEEDDGDGYMEEMERVEDLEEIAEAAMLEWNKQQSFAVDLPSSAGLAEVDRNPNIAKNPWSWSIDDARCWCDWALMRFRVTDTQRNHLLKNLQLSGNDLCRFSVSEFQQHFQTSGKYLYAELELWKNIYIISSSESEQRLYDAKFDRDELDVASKSTAVSGCIPLCPNASSEEIASSSVATNYSPPCVSTVRPPFVSSSTPLLSALTSDLSTTPTTASQLQSSNSLRHFPTSLEQRIPTFVVDSTPDTPTYESESSGRGPLQLSEYTPSGGVGGKETEGIWGSCFDSTRLLSDADSGVSLDSDCASSYDAAQKTSSGDDSPEIWQSHAKHGNHLWQFLHELLRQPSLYVDCIRWMDRKQGIFKIEDSVHVAKLWGERKNRPAMNYDKLSRSIRQYYKKGIIRKTNQSKRLVYQFCPRYA